MIGGERTKALCLASAFNTPVWDDPTDDPEGNQRWCASDEARQHLASLSPERRAELEQEWN